MPEKQRKLYALLVGVDKYKSIRGLAGCVNDVIAMREYLESAAKQDDLKADIKFLLDEDAVKDNIVKNFTEHLIDRPGPDDIALFYYAGHGGQEAADEVFHASAANKKNEVLICYDSSLDASGMDLADKEMRYLIHKAAQKGSHLVTIFDCCHAGGNTRSAAAPKILTRQLAAGKPMRDYEDFIFAKEIPKSKFASGLSLNEIIPQGNHIQIAACREREEANEYPGSDEPRGAFSYALLDVLKKSQGGISYYDLYSRLKMSIANLVHDMQVIDPRVISQTPQIYVRADDSAEVFRPFLNGAVNQQRRFCNLIFDKKKDSWKVDMGAIHGVKHPNDGETRIYAFEEGADVNGEPTHTGVVTWVTPSEAGFKFEGEEPEGTFLAGFVKGLLTRPVSVFLDGEAAGSKVIRDYFNEEDTQKSIRNKVSLVEAKEDADYLLVAKDGEYLVTLPDNPRPIVEQITGYTTNAAAQAAVYFKHMSNWEFVRSLSNPNSNLTPKPPVSMEILRTKPDGTGGERVPVENGIITWENDPEKEQGEYGLKFKLRLTNNTDQKLHCSVAYLSQNFQVFPSILQGNVVEIDHGANNVEWALGGSPIPFRVNPYIKEYNWEYAVDYFKLVVSTQPFSLESMALPELPAPRVGDQKRSGTRSSFSFTPPQPKEEHDWTTLLIEIRTKNPYYKAEAVEA